MYKFEDGKTPLSAETFNKMQKVLLETIFPVGSTYVTQDTTNPANILNFGIWERFNAKIALGLDEADTDFDAIRKIGGEKKHTLTVDEMPKHSHNGNYLYNGTHSITNMAIDSGMAGQGLIATTDVGAGIQSPSTGGSQSHNNMQPYEIVGYMWIRRG